ncbi:MAG: hypothetical protein ACXU99_09375, partial [Thermodesulfobacteriota bacterium]
STNLVKSVYSTQQSTIAIVFREKAWGQGHGGEQRVFINSVYRQENSISWNDFRSYGYYFDFISGMGFSRRRPVP